MSKNTLFFFFFGKVKFWGFFGSDMSKSSELAWYVERPGLSREKSKSQPISTRNPWPPLPWSVRKSNSSSRIANRFWKKNNFCFDFCDILIVFSISSGFPSDLGRVGDPENRTKIKQNSPRSSKIVDFGGWPTWLKYSKYELKLCFSGFYKRWLPRPLPRPSWLHFGLHFGVILGPTSATILFFGLLFLS